MLLTLLCFILFILTLPGTVELLFLTVSAIRGRPESEGTPSSLETLEIAVVIPAHNEEVGISKTLLSLQNCDPALPNQNIYVIADNCSDDTATVSEDMGVNVLERQNEQERGKGYALNYAFAHLQALEKYDAFLIVDADTTVENNFISSYQDLFGSGADAGQSSYRVDQYQTNTRTRLMNIAFLGINHLRPLGREKAGLSAGILGNGFGLSANTLQEIPYDSYSIVEDLEYHLRLIRAGKKVEFLEQTSVRSEMPANAKDAESQRARWEGGRFKMIRQIAPKLCMEVMRGKLRMLEPLLELLLLPLAYHFIWLLFLMVLAWFTGVGFLIYSLLAMIIFVLHIVVAMYLGGCDKHDVFALFKAPGYILWKLLKLGKIFKMSKDDAGWQRTKR